jgi:TolA-binding protein
MTRSAPLPARSAPCRRRPRLRGNNPPPAAAPPRDAAADYSRARELLAAGQFAEAEVAFADFLERYPNVQTPDARFWYAFTLLARNNYRCRREFRSVPAAHAARSARARSASASRHGARMARDGNNDAAERQACGAFSSLATRYPNAPRNVRDLATREARAANCA